jgi:hypothetical protein
MKNEGNMTPSNVSNSTIMYTNGNEVGEVLHKQFTRIITRSKQHMNKHLKEYKENTRYEGGIQQRDRNSEKSQIEIKEMKSPMSQVKNPVDPCTVALTSNPTTWKAEIWRTVV